MTTLKAAWRHQIALTAFGGKRPRLKKPGRPTPPMAEEMAYKNSLQEKFIAPYREAADRILIPRLPLLVKMAEKERRDSWRSTLDTVVKLVHDTRSDTQTTEAARKAATAMAVGVDKRNADQLHRMIVRAVGVDVWMHNPVINEITPRLIEKNVSYITSIPKQSLAQVSEVVEKGIRSGMRVEDLAEEIHQRFRVADSRAALIARDQVGTFNGELMQVRQKAVGIDGYFWRGVLDDRERDEHVDREGERFAWADPPDGGHPGEDYQCRCVAEPDFSFLEDL